VAANVGKGESTKCGEILMEWGVDVNMKDDSKRTPLHVASLRGNITLIEKLLKVPSILAEEQDEFGMTPLYLAARYKNEESLTILLKNGSNVNVRDR
jgi:ankyrin repeat protein